MNSIKVVLVVFGFRRRVDGNRIDAETSNLQATPKRPIPL